jgi:cyclophilin family peptidyl-prolyl cis-trans isomerase/HEAT repeat protein
LRPPPLEVKDLEIRGLLLLLSDRHLFESLTVERALKGDVELRRQLARTLGRVPRANSVPVLKALMLDSDAAVRAAAVFALGQLRAVSAQPLLLRAVADADREVGIQAVGALGLLGVSALDVGEALAELGEAEFWPRLLPFLYRFEGEAALALASLGLEQTAADGSLQGWAAYALAQHAGPAVEGPLLGLLSHPDPWVRGQAARGLGTLEGFSNLEALRPLVEGEEEGPILAALDVARRQIDSGTVAPPQAWVPILASLIRDPRPGVRQAAVRAAGSWLLEPRIMEPLTEAASRPGPLGGTALLSLARAGHPRAPEWVAESAASPSPEQRWQAVNAAAVLGLWQLVDVLAKDPEPLIRAAALAVRLEAGEDAGQGAEELLRQALAEADPGIRHVALEWLEKHPLLSAKELFQAVHAAARDRVVAPRLAAIWALVSRARRMPSEEREILEGLLELCRVGDYLLRRQAAGALEDLGYQAPDIGSVASFRTAEAYQEIVLRSSRRLRLQIKTDRGDLMLDLDCPEVPLSCQSFRQLAAQGFYDGLKFFRVRPGFLVQAGDPRGDGLGGPGYSLRDEIHPQRFERGTVGLAAEFPDSGGSQFFITLSRQPHLDGRYTVLGEVTQGLEVLSQLAEGDSILGAEILP